MWSITRNDVSGRDCTGEHTQGRVFPRPAALFPFVRVPIGYRVSADRLLTLVRVATYPSRPDESPFCPRCVADCAATDAVMGAPERCTGSPAQRRRGRCNYQQRAALRSAFGARAPRGGLRSLAVALLGAFAATASPAVALPPGFTERTVVFSGLDHPTAVRFAADGRVFVAEKSGLIKVFDSLADTTPTHRSPTCAPKVHNFWDRGLLGLALDPEFPAPPYVYVLYTYDAAIGGTAPRWGTPGATTDGCPTPPGADRPTAASSAAGSRGCTRRRRRDDRARAGAGRRLVPAVPEPLGRRPRVRPRRRALRQRRRRRELQRRRLRARTASPRATRAATRPAASGRR